MNAGQVIRPPAQNGVAPSTIAATPGGNHVWVGSSISVGAGMVWILDTSTNTQVASFPVGHGPGGPQWISFSADGARAYLANRDDTVSVVDTSTLTELWSVTVGSTPSCVEPTRDGDYLYVANRFSANVSIVELATHSVVTNVTIGGGPVSLAVTPDGSQVYVTKLNSLDNVAVIDPGRLTLSKKSTAGGSFASNARLGSLLVQKAEAALRMERGLVTLPTHGG